MRHYILLAVTTGLLAVGCAPAYVSTGYSAGYYGPELAYVSPGVQVVAGYDQPVFYADNVYWRYDNNRWYRSNYYNRGWVYAAPPRAILSIDRPYRYRNYRSYRAAPSNRSYVRDHRGSRGRVYAPSRTYRANPRGSSRAVRPAPVRRDFRNAPVRRDTPARRDRSRVRDHRR